MEKKYEGKKRFPCTIHEFLVETGPITVFVFFWGGFAQKGCHAISGKLRLKYCVMQCRGINVIFKLHISRSLVKIIDIVIIGFGCELVGPFHSTQMIHKHDSI